MAEPTATPASECDPIAARADRPCGRRAATARSRRAAGIRSRVSSSAPVEGDPDRSAGRRAPADRRHRLRGELQLGAEAAADVFGDHPNTLVRTAEPLGDLVRQDAAAASRGARRACHRPSARRPRAARMPCAVGPGCARGLRRAAGRRSRGPSRASDRAAPRRERLVGPRTLPCHDVGTERLLAGTGRLTTAAERIDLRRTGGPRGGGTDDGRQRLRTRPRSARAQPRRCAGRPPRRPRPPARCNARRAHRRAARPRRAPRERESPREIHPEHPGVRMRRTQDHPSSWPSQRTSTV